MEELAAGTALPRWDLSQSGDGHAAVAARAAGCLGDAIRIWHAAASRRAGACGGWSCLAISWELEHGARCELEWHPPSGRGGRGPWQNCQRSPCK